MPKMSNETIDKSQSLKSVRLIKVDGTQNNNKYWCCWLMPDGKLYAEFGRLRVGVQGATSAPKARDQKGYTWQDPTHNTELIDN